MGFRISVRTSPSPTCDYDNKSSKEFYQFISTYDQYGDESLLVQSGRYFGLDLTPLTNLIYLDVQRDYLNSAYQSLNTVYGLMKSFYDHMKASPEFIYKIRYKYRRTYGQMSAFQEYFSSGRAEQDMLTVLEVLELYRKRGVEQVFLGAE